jgi:dCMP deaminase
MDNRISWDEYFMSIAALAACRSPCGRLQVGSVIVKDNRLVSMGYNGFLPGCEHVSYVRDGHEQATVHSEINALTDCAKRGVCVANSTIYVTHYPCINCFKALCASGIKKIVYLQDYNNDPLITALNNEAKLCIKQLYTESKSSASSSVSISSSDK